MLLTSLDELAWNCTGKSCLVREVIVHLVLALVLENGINKAFVLKLTGIAPGSFASRTHWLRLCWLVCDKLKYGYCERLLKTKASSQTGTGFPFLSTVWPNASPWALVDARLFSLEIMN